MTEAAIDAPVAPPFTCAVTALAWERVQLTIRVELQCLEPPLDDEAPVRFALVEGKRHHTVQAIAIGDRIFDLHINVTRFSGRRAIPDGTWRIVATTGTMQATATYDGRSLEILDEKSRVFMYDKNRSGYTVSFGIADSIDRLDFLMRTYYLQRPAAKPKKKLRPWRSIKKRYFSTSAVERYAARFYAAVNRYVGPRPGRVLFASDQRADMQGNLLRVHDRMVERGLDARLDLRYSFRLPNTTAWTRTVQILWLMATSEVILLDDYFGLLQRMPTDAPAKRRPKIIQLWHAGSGFKAVGFSRFGISGSPKLRHPHRRYTYAITGSEHLVPVYAEAFGIEESAVVPTGLPRVDWFLDEERTRTFVEGFRAEFREIAGRRIVLFAPTFRGRSIHTAFYDYSTIDFDALYEACGADTVVLFRMHHFVEAPVPIRDEHRDRFFDFTKYPDGLGLLHVTDLLITDYSSIIYEYSLLDRPMAFYAPDKVNYAATRGFHRDYDETAPGRICTTFDDLLDALRTGEFEQHKVARFREENIDHVDTGSADRVIDWLILGEPSEQRHPVPVGTATEPTAALSTVE